MVSSLSSQLLAVCQLCPRQCSINRLSGPAGFCRTDAGYAIAAITLHQGEEPVIGGASGICNVFFAHCNLGCIYCQNYQISRNNYPLAELTLDQVVQQIGAILDTGVDRLGFVTASHMVPQMIAIIAALHDRGYFPVIVYNTSCYDRVETLRLLDDWVDVYLPDYKYADPLLAARWSGAADYPEVALAALKEMYRQRGWLMHTDEQGVAHRGLLVRHLVLPGAVANTVAVLQTLARNFSPKMHLSLMAQYQPNETVRRTPNLHRCLYPEEYQEVVEELHRLPFANVWLQSLDSAASYNPDFNREDPFATSDP